MASSYKTLSENLSQVETAIGYTFKNADTLLLSFVHRSFFNEHKKEVKEHNERLEFLGDSVLGVLVSEYLYARYPEESEGRLSHLRAMLVEASMCAKFVGKLQLAQFILLGKGEIIHLGRNKESIQADFFEALLGAIYLDGGKEASEQFFWGHFQKDIEESLKTPLRNWKAELQDVFQKNYQTLPMYKVIEESGPDHNKQFTVGVFLRDKQLGLGVGSSKKEGEQAAAKEALLKVEEDGGKNEDALGV